MGRFPERGGAAMFAEADDALAGVADIGFDAGVIDFFERAAGMAGQGEKTHFSFELGDGRKIDFPEIEIGIEEGYAVGVEFTRGADVADDANFGFLVALGPAEDEFLLGGEFVARKDTSAVEAEEDGVRVFRENSAVEIAADQDDGNFFRNASSAAHNLLWQAGSQSGTRSGPIPYLVVRNGRMGVSSWNERRREEEKAQKNARVSLD